MPAHPDFGSLSYWGGYACGLGGLILAGMSVSEIRRARNSLRRTTAMGRVTHAVEQISKHGGVTGKVVSVTFTTVHGARIKFTESVDERYFHMNQEVTVRYDPEHPRDTATVLTKRAAFTRVLWYVATSAPLLLVCVLDIVFGYR